MKSSIAWLGAILLAFSLCITIMQPMKVNAAEKKVTVNVKNERANIIKGNKVILTPTLKNAKIKKVKFKSENKNIAVVNSSGQVTGRNAGTARIVITVTATNGKAYKKTAKVFVKNKKTKHTPNIEMSVHKTISPQNKATIQNSLKIGRRSIKNITYKSSNNEIATVNKKGVVTAKSAGTANITVTAVTNDGHTINTKQKITVPHKSLTSHAGINYFNGRKETWYTQKRYPGHSLNIPGRQLRRDNVVVDKDGYVVVAMPRGNKGRIVETSLGTAKCYDTNPSNSVDIYTNW